MCVCAYVKTLGCNPIASLDHFQPEMLGSAEIVEEVPTGDSKVVKVTPPPPPAVTRCVILIFHRVLMLSVCTWLSG